MTASVIILVGFVGLAVIVGMWAMGIYNGLIRKRNAKDNNYSQIGIQLTRKYDLIPNLVKLVKGYMKHERTTLEEVIQARNMAANANAAVSANPGDPAAMKQMVAAEGTLGGVMGRLFALSESYPDLKANQNMMQLTEELTSTENKVTFARQAFNDSVMGYNNALQVFPANMVAGMFGFTEAIFFEVEGLGDVGKAVVTADQKKDLDISFDDM
ncbi:MAG: LemA family protein [Verrucomicrobia bacterium]|nr:LemA family protein [Verrucomicrobiota bacterium]MBT4900768.1 LemA family protein [Verrucomicrobiota bacterium]MBT6790206.1 LemA family protein [Verrucomicrobiota bacterium]MBT7911567.1 LemA family protein [Verrucomicrobiota bacterium]